MLDPAALVDCVKVSILPRDTRARSFPRIARKVYVIGGIVDRTRHSGLSKAKAGRLGAAIGGSSSTGSADGGNRSSTGTGANDGGGSGNESGSSGDTGRGGGSRFVRCCRLPLRSVPGFASSKLVLNVDTVVFARYCTATF